MFHKFLKPLTVGAFAIALNASAALPIAKLERKSTVDFEKEILPVLRANCLACHNTTKAKAGSQESRRRMHDSSIAAVAAVYCVRNLLARASSRAVYYM